MGSAYRSFNGARNVWRAAVVETRACRMLGSLLGFGVDGVDIASRAMMESDELADSREKRAAAAPRSVAATRSREHAASTPASLVAGRGMQSDESAGLRRPRALSGGSHAVPVIGAFSGRRRESYLLLLAGRPPHTPTPAFSTNPPTAQAGSATMTGLTVPGAGASLLPKKKEYLHIPWPLAVHSTTSRP